MANEKQLAILKKGAQFWNRWREENPETTVDLWRANLKNNDLKGINLSKANLRRAILSGANLTRADLTESDLQTANLTQSELVSARLTRSILTEANLRQANLTDADLNITDLSKSILRHANFSLANLKGANLSEADLSQADLSKADLSDANLTRADLWGVNFSDANLSRADLSKTNLDRASLVGAIVDQAKISGSAVYGISVWDLHGEFGEQKDLVITPTGARTITVDNIKIAQFIYLILNNEVIRDVLNTLTAKSILILGRFSIPERKMILDALKNKLREYNLLPIVFDFDRPADKDFTETIKTLAGLCYFVIADVTNPKSSPLELQATVPDYQIPFVPIIQEGESPFAMMANLQTKYNWVLNTVTYDSEDTLVKILKPLIIDPAMKKHNELRIIKAQVPQVISGKDYLDKGK